jgi:phosphatidylglycerol:prolipoprotein diacylglycerol transferase
LIVGAFALVYGIARMISELFREPDAQLGFLWGGLTMGMLLCIPLMIGGIILIVVAVKRQPGHA